MKNKMNITRKCLFGLLASLLLLASCDDLLVTKPSSALSDDEVYNDYTRARLQLSECYKGVPQEPNIDLEYYTDNAVKNSKSLRSASGGMTAEDFPVKSKWANSIKYIMIINEYLEEGFRTGVYDIYDSIYSDQLIARSKGEAYGLRAYYQWELLKNFAGPSAEDPNVMLGFPIITASLSLDSVNAIPRASYLECMQQINADIDSAYNLIGVMRYNGNLKMDDNKNIGRISGEMLLALKARMYLFAASEAYQQVSWDSAAHVAYDAIDKIDHGNLQYLEKSYYSFNKMDNGDDFWRSRYHNNATLENRHFPPSLYGKGQCNPSQNLVDCFPTITGYPITDMFATYDANKPYTGRDKRLEWFIFHNGMNTFRDTVVINAYNGGEDANGGILTIATRTGYYMKKYLSQTVNLIPYGSLRKDKDFSLYAIFTRQGLYLDFAEAAFEAYGITGKADDMSFSAGEALAKVRFRAGMEFDYYLNSMFNPFLTFEDLLAAVRVERRIEFAFEGERYYDVRRWKTPMSELNIDVLGVDIELEADASTVNYSADVIVEPRVFTEKMYYNPIPREEIIKSDALIQNNLW